MELQILDPFEDYETAGYLRKVYREKDLRLVGHLETAVFEQEVLSVVRHLRRIPLLDYDDVMEAHQRLFSSLYPWAGQDRSSTAPGIAIVKGGYKTLFAHPAECRRAAEYALRRARQPRELRAHPGEIFGYLAHSHPFLEGNGRTILTVFAELTRREAFHIKWEHINKEEFLGALTGELLQPGHGTMDDLILPFVHDRVLTAEMTARRLQGRFYRSRETI